MTTHTWDEAFHQLWAHAARHRGMSGTLPEHRSDDTQGWPRTRGSDVLAIAAVVDPVVRTLPMEPGSFGIERRWRHCTTDVVELALARSTEEYAQNRAFWPTLAATLAYLASIHVPVPHDLWRALLAEIASPRDSRDVVGDDYLHLTADSYEELWRLQKATLSQLRGAEVLEPSGDTSGPRMIPRTTNRDVLQLAAFWTLALIKIESKRLSLAPDVLATLGLDGVQRRWHAVLADLDAHALNADPREVYAKNPAFWRATAAVSVAISAIDDMPLSLDLAVSGGRPERRNARTVEIKESTFDKTWTAQHDQLVKARGADVREPPPGVVGAPMHVPRTTYADVRQLATYWQDALTAVDDPGRHGDALHRIATPAGLAEERTRWQAVMADIDQLVKANPSDVYAKNHEFWRASQSLATTLGRIHPRPVPPSKLTLDVPEEGLGDRLLDFVKDLPGQIADAAGAVADAVGTLGRDAGAGFFEGLGVPLLIGAGGLVALWLLLRRPDRREAE